MTFGFKVSHKCHAIGNSWNDFIGLITLGNNKVYRTIAQLQPALDNHGLQYDACDVIGDIIGITWHFKNILHHRLGYLKCSILHLGPHNPSLSYTLNHNPLPVANSVRDLGITFNCKLKFDEYINKIVFKAFQLVNLIFRSFVSRCPKILCRAFKTYIRPILEYCTPVWSPYLLCDINIIESVQKYFTRRLFPGKQFTYGERLSLTNLATLESRRIRFDLIMYYKIINNLVDLDSSKFFNSLSHSFNTRGHAFKLSKQIYSTNSLANNFANRAINCWNALPPSVVSSHSLMQFKFNLSREDLMPFCVGSCQWSPILSVHSNWTSPTYSFAL